MSSPQTSVPDVSPAKHPRQSRLAWIAERLISVGLFFAAGVLLIVIVGLAQRLGWLHVPESDATPTDVTSATDQTVFTCPMHPNIRQPGPGRCPICGMELVPATNDSANLDELSVTIEPAQRRLANIQTAVVASGPLNATLRTVGAIAIDESRQATISAYIDGRLERLLADYTGVHIAKGDHLAILYSPQLYAAQVEYVESLRALQEAGGPSGVRQAQESLAANTRQRLRELGMTDQQIAEVERTGNAQSRLTIYAPQGGTVVEKLAVEGNYVKAGDPIYRIADLSTVWLMLKLFPEDASRIRFGQSVEAEVQSLPGQTFLGRVAFIDPVVDPQTRTVSVRVELMNEGGRLRPGDYAEARITLPIGPQGNVYDADLAGKWISPMHPQIIRDEPGQCPICGMDLVPASQFGFADKPVPQPESVYVPRSAVLMAGGNSVVYVETEPGKFEIRPVTIGPILEDKVIILDGLKPGERVATAGNFLIDSQMQLAGKPSLFDPARAMAKSSKSKNAERPLHFDKVVIIPVPGDTGRQLESLYAAYFKVQQALADDQLPPAEAAQELHNLAALLDENSALPGASTKFVGEIASTSEHLQHMDLPAARKAFKPISHAIVSLAAQVRSADATQPFTHFYCPMVPGGGGDWLQDNDELLNPYFGGEMLRCGEKVEVFAPVTEDSTDTPAADHSLHPHEGA